MTMIAKFDKIASIGKFRNYSAKGDVSFKEFTVIFADNGCGKTTLAAIIRSLLLNDDAILRKRVSDNPTLDQAVILTTKDHLGNKVTISFGKAGWKKTYDNIEIFDTVFVNENIYSGFDISDAHKKNLHEFVVGAQGVITKRKILKNKKDKEDTRHQLDEIANDLIIKVAYGLTADKVKEFIKITKEDAAGITDKITSAKKELRTAQSQKSLLKYPDLPIVDKWTSGINFSNLKNDVEASSKTIKDKTLERLFERHVSDLSEHSVSGAEDWLRAGFEYVTNKRESSKTNNLHGVNCPFCQQRLSNSIDIIKAYSQLFDAEFNEYIERLQSHVTKVSRFNLQALVVEKNATKKVFTERLDYWKEYLEDDLPRFSVLTDSKSMQVQYEAMKGVVESKCKNPSTSKAAKGITEFKERLDEVNANIDKTNKFILGYNARIKTFKAKIRDPSVAEKHLIALQRIQKRFDPVIMQLCKSYSEKSKELQKLEAEYTQLSQNEEKEANTFIKDYSDKINYYLRDVFGTPFQIKNMIHGNRKGKAKDAKVDYQLLLNGKPISFDPDEAFSIRDCLSEGDKSTIAFSFFLSKLEIDPQLVNKVLVYDDPLSSLDKNRRHKTVSLISEISKSIKQTIVLSHNESFLWELYKDYDAGRRKALRINQDHIDDNSFLEDLDIEFLVEHEYFVHIKELEVWLKKPDIRKKERIIGLIRNVLESHIKFKFYRQLASINLSKQTFGVCIEELVTQGTPFRNDKSRDNIITLLRELNAISCGPHHGGPPPDPKHLGRDPSKITDTELASYVKQTFTLIDNDL
jgi:wobble nucleotide-excising tRNase